MKKNELETKMLIMDVTTGLIREYGDISRITIRDICSRANVGVGTVNYHFQTKENLIDQCVQSIIDNIIGGFDDLAESLDLEPYDKIRFLFKTNIKFLVENIGISKVSIMSDLISGSDHDNSIQTRDAYLRLLRKVYGQRKSDEELKSILYLAVATLQITFLRMEIIKKVDGLDLTTDEGQERFMDIFMDRLFYDLKEKNI
jgi:AcrR family transcriptional regulator